VDWFEIKNQIRWVPGEKSLPMRTVRKQSYFGGLFVTFGILFALLAAASMVSFITWCTREWGLSSTAVLLAAVLLAMLLFIVVDLVFIFMGLHLLLSEATIVITNEAVEYTGRGLSGRNEWAEPLENYQGVVKRFANQDHLGTCYEITLKHDDENKDVILFRARNAAAEILWDESWRQFGQLLKLPLLEETADGLVRAGPGSLQELTARYAAMRSRSGAVQLSKKAVVSQTEEGVRIIHPHYWGCWRGLLGTIICLIVLGWAYYLFQSKRINNAWIFPALVSLLLIAFCSFIADLLTVEELLIRPGRVEYRRQYGKRIKSHKVVRLMRIKQVAVKKASDFPVSTPLLWLEDGLETVQFGALLPKGDKVALKEYILARSLRT